ncbi:MAG: hypothetical protein ABH879_01040 [archaeon]
MELGILKPNPKRIIIAAMAYAMAAIPLPILPVMMNVMCKAGVPCPPVFHLVSFLGLWEHRFLFAGVQWIVLALEVAIIYFAVCVAMRYRP